MPMTSPSPRFGFQGARRDPIAKTARSTTPAASVKAAFRGSLGRSARTTLMGAGSLQERADPVEVLEGDAHRGAVRAHLHAGGPLRARLAEVALGRDLDGFAVRALLPPIDHHDVVPGAPLGAVRAADARGLVDRHLEGAHLAGDRPRRAVDHADGIGALVTRGRDQPVAVLLALPDEARLAAVGVR